MAKYSDEKRIEHKELVKDALVQKPRASLRELSILIDKNVGQKFDPHYILKIVSEVRDERRKRYSDDPEVQERIAEMEDKMRRLQEEMWKIVLDESVYLTGSEIGHPKTSNSSKIKAALAIIKSEKDLLEAQMDAGVFERKLGTIDVDADAGEYQPILNAMFNLGMIKDNVPSAKYVEAKEVKTKQINGPTTTKKQSNTSKGSDGKKLPSKSRKGGRA